jgi:diguanylate cyclase (GGDEF)-like protein
LINAAYKRLAIVVKELQGLVSIDGLTQVANRRYLDEYLEQECKRASREQIPISLVLCDIDFFKNYNDNYGHQAGVLCLKSAAQAISQATKRPADLLARYGGEEFEIVLPNTDREGGLSVAVRATKIVRSLKLPHAHSSAADHVTISCGVGTLLHTQHLQAINLLKASDLA